MDIASIAQPSRSDGAESIKVLVRVRPLSSSELAERNDSVVEILSNQALNVTSADGKKSFKCAFDSVLGPNSSQTEVYDIVRGCTESVIDGFNSTIFAYGQTGSGKVRLRRCPLSCFSLQSDIISYTLCVPTRRPTRCTVLPQPRTRP